MLKKLLFTVGFVCVASFMVFSQSGTLKGKISDKSTKEPIPFANIIIALGGTQVGGATSDFDGNFTIKPIPPGKYDVKATYVGYKGVLMKGLFINSDKITFQDLEMEPTSTTLSEVEVVDYKVPLISKDQTSSGATVTSEEISKMPNRSASSVASTVGGVFSADGETGSVRGQRSEGTVMYIDGIKVRGSTNLPQSSIDQVSVILGGVPAQYGDATGGIINVTTKGPSRTFGAGVDFETSQFLDNFGHNRVGLNMNGPLIKKGKGDNATALLGYFFAGEYNFEKDGNPSGIGIWKVKDSKLAELKATPLRLGNNGSTSMTAEYLRKTDLEHVKTTQNTNSTDISLSGKLDVKTGPNINLSFGGSFVYDDSKGFSLYNSLINWENNYQVLQNTWRVYGKFTQRFPGDKDSKSLVKNVYYTIQADYTRFHQTVQDPRFKDNLFKYGYIGKFERSRIRSYEMGYDTIAKKTAWLQNNWQDTLITFTRSETNPVLANYTEQYFSLRNNEVRKYQDISNVQGGLINGDSPSSVYGIFANVGTVQLTQSYQLTDNSQLGFSINGSADIGNHAIQVGLQYEQRSDRSFNVGAQSLWELMRGYTNAHIEQLDFSKPYLAYNNGVFAYDEENPNGIFLDTIQYDRIYDAGSQRTFDKNLRKALGGTGGLAVNGTDYIDIDSYDINNNTINYYDKNGTLHKNVPLNEPLNIKMFSADELLNNGSGNSVVGYYGYDYKGNKQTSKPSFEDFFTKTDEDGNLTRPIGAFEPIYMAGYVQDVFAFKDLIFNVGLRIDRFDANQMVLKDPYLLYDAHSVKENEVQDLAKEMSNYTIPSNMKDNYVVYVDKVNQPTKIVGFRNNDVWYNASGIEISDPEKSLNVGNGVSPFLVDPTNQTLTSKVFRDYQPQTNVLPRISFSFPISDEALFFAHYDVLTQRPTQSLRMDPTSYYFLPVRSSPTINNPNLKSEKTIDYELGFQQKLNNTSSLILSTYYREVRDQIQSFRYTAAYPKTYYSYSNIDFGTVKGLTVTYDLRRTNNARVRASYTLQFANGTGSDAETSKALITSGQPNLRNLIPLNFDRRHAINLLIDYRYDEGKNYNGPTIKRKIKGTDKYENVQLLKNTGLSITINGGSGTPYTKYQKAGINGNGKNISGNINGSRLPWQFRMEARLDRDIYFGKSTFVNVYLQVLNVLDARNIMNVYGATGNADDDGYLSSAEYQAEINQQLDPQSYRELYQVYINKPGNYSSPRMIRLGLSLNF